MRLPRTRLLLVVLAALMVPATAWAQASGICDGAQMVAMPDGSTACTHGDDPASRFPAPTHARELSTAATSEDPSVACISDGTSGERIQFLYVVAEDQPNRASTVVPQIRQAAFLIDEYVMRSAEVFDAGFRVRWVHDAACVLDVQTVVVPSEADGPNFGTMVDALATAGYDEPGRHYVSWVDAEEFCGLASYYPHEEAGDTNHNNGKYPNYARIDRGCFQHSPSFAAEVTLHEITHMLGAVQKNAPNATAYGHCSDEYDIMCYPDGAGVAMRVVCDDQRRGPLWDCGGDDYFNPNPAAGSYLDRHWNIARSRFLEQIVAVPQDPVQPPVEESNPDSGSQFADVAADNPFRTDIDWLATSGITKGCNPPDNSRFCPDDSVTRGQMAAFLIRALSDPPPLGPSFSDSEGTVFAEDVRRLAGAGITHGCGPDAFCPGDRVTRGQMAAFLGRAFDLPPTDRDFFADDDGTVFEDDINRLAAAGITSGCDADSYCAERPITRAQMAAFLRRALS